MSLLITDALWLNPRGRTLRGAVLIRRGRITELGPQIDAPAHVKRLSARGARLVPAAIDAHTHLRQPGQAYKEGIDRGTRAALAGGVTSLLDMPNNAPPCTTPCRVEAKRALFAHHSHCHYGLFAQAGRRLVDLPYSRLAGLKIYMAKSSGLPAVNEHDQVADWLRRAPRVAVHAEDERCFLPGEKQHHRRRPRAAIRAALATLEAAYLSLPERQRPRLILCHASSVDELRWLRRMKASGHDVWGEVCLHYLRFTQDDLRQRGALYQVNPPLRTRADREALREAVAGGHIDFIASDHAPHRPTEKNSANPPSGIAGIEFLLPFAAQLVADGLIDWRRMAELCTLAPARCYEIRDRGSLTAGQVADLVLLQRCGDSFSHPLISGAGCSPFAASDFDYLVDTTLVAGVIAYQRGHWPVRPRVTELYS